MNARGNSGLISTMISKYKQIDFSKDKIAYALFFTHITSFVLLIKEIISYIILTPNEVNEKYYFLIAGSLMFAIFIITAMIYADKISLGSKFVAYLLKIYPFIFPTLGSLTLFVYIDADDTIFLFVFAIIATSFMQIYDKLRRLWLFSYALVLFNVINYITEGFNSVFFNNLLRSSIVVSIGFIIAIIHNLTYTSEIKVANALDRKSKEQLAAINKLEKSYKDLSISQRITERMLEITEEILANEDLDDVLQIVLEEAIKLVPKAQAGSILISRNNKIVFVAAHGYNLNLLKKVELEFDDLFQSTIENKYEATIIQDVEVFDSAHLNAQKMNGLREVDTQMALSCMTCSFKWNDEFFGSINLDNFDSKDIYNEEDKYLLQQLVKEIEIIISIHKLYEQAIRPSKIDELTKAYTRKYGFSLIENMISKNQKLNYSLCFIDLNNLKEVNDDLGHDAGDRYLQHFGESAKKVKIKENIFSRLGGDEFLLVFKNINKENAENEINVLREYLKNNPIEIQGKTLVVGFASGISEYGIDSKDTYELVKIADKRMYENKQQQKKK